MSNVVVRFVGDTTSLSRAFTRVGAEGKAFENGVHKTGARAESMATQMGTFARGMSLVAIPIALAGGAAIKTAIDYEDSINKMTRLAGVSAVQAASWSAEILKMSGKVGVGPKELAEALYFIASSGTDVSKSMGVLKVAAKGTAIGMGDVSKTADALTSVVNVYGASNISAARAGDILTAAVREGKGEADAYARTVGRILPVAQQLGSRFEDVAGAMSVVTNRGLSASEAATGIRQAMIAILKPSKAGNQVLAAAGTNMDNIRKTLREKGMLAALRELRAAAGGSEEAFSKLQPNVRGLNAALILTSEEGAAKSNEIFRKVAASTGDLDVAFEKASTTSKLSFSKALSTLKVVGIELGQEMLPVLKSIADWVGGVVSKFGDLSPGIKTALAAFIFVTLALVPLVAMFSALSTTIGALASPIGLAIGAGILLAWGAIYLYNNWKPFKELVDSAGASIKAWAEDVQTYFPIGADIITTKVQAMSDDISTNFPKGIQVIKDAFTSMKDWASDKLSGLKNLWDRSWTTIKDTFTRFVATVKEVWAGAWETISGVWQTFAGLFTGQWGRMWDGIKQVFTGVWDTLFAVARGTINSIASVIGFAMATISWLWSGAWNSIKTTVSTVWGVISSIIAGAINGIKVFVWAGLSAVGSFVTTSWDGVVDFMSNLPTRISNAMSGAWDGIKSAFKSALNWIIDKWNSFGFTFPTIDVPIIGKVGGWRFDTPDIPRFHTGGVVPGIPGQEVLAVLKAGETVRTAAQERTVSGGSMTASTTTTTNGATFNVVQNFYGADPRDAARESARELHWLAKTSGR